MKLLSRCARLYEQRNEMLARQRQQEEEEEAAFAEEEEYESVEGEGGTEGEREGGEEGARTSAEELHCYADSLQEMGTRLLDKLKSMEGDNKAVGRQFIFQELARVQNLIQNQIKYEEGSS